MAHSILYEADARHEWNTPRIARSMVAVLDVFGHFPWMDSPDEVKSSAIDAEESSIRAKKKESQLIWSKKEIRVNDFLSHDRWSGK